MLRSILAVVVGFLVIGALSFGADAALSAAGVMPHGQPVTGTGLLLLSMAYVAVFAIFGCWLAAYLAPSRPMLHALVLGVLGLVFNAVAAAATRGQVPDWYLAVSLALVMPYAWAGGKLREMQLARGRAPGLAS